MLICPICQTPLTQAERTLRCDRGHSFDVAREGYVNLAMAAGARARAVGDSRAMLTARRAFLAGGHYAPLAEALVSRLRVECAPDVWPSHRLLDVGCGEGYYLGYLAERLHSGAPHIPDAQPRLYGLDVARDAIRMAARRYPTIQFVVANLRDGLPFATHSLDVVLDIFAPRDPGEFARVLAPGGVLLVAIPRPDHLRELRAALSLIGIEQEKQQRVVEQCADHFALCAEQEISYTLDLSGEALRHLVAMMPSARHLAPPDWERVQALPQMSVQASFALLAFRSKAG